MVGQSHSNQSKAQAIQDTGVPLYAVDKVDKQANTRWI